jgi:hypothetical protein
MNLNNKIINPPERDPEWPQEIKTMADVILRRKIKSKYKLNQ